MVEARWSVYDVLRYLNDLSRVVLLLSLLRGIGYKSARSKSFSFSNVCQRHFADIKYRVQNPKLISIDNSAIENKSNCIVVLMLVFQAESESAVLEAIHIATGLSIL